MAASGRSESSLMISLVDTLGTGPVAEVHVVYIHLSDELGELSIQDGRTRGARFVLVPKLTVADRAIGGRPRPTGSDLSRS